jgi:energy-converting hydrogenase Eha subunit G
MEQHEIDGLTILERAALPTPKFFRILKVIGLTLAAASGTLLAAPVVLPAIVTTIAGYVAVAGTVATAISQVTVES